MRSTVTDLTGGKSKKQKVIHLDSQSAPVGYHYEGESCTIVDGRPTLRLRRDILGSREDKYRDCYARQEEIKDGKRVITFHCCIPGL